MSFEPEFSRPVIVERIDRSELFQKVEAEPFERTSIASRLKLPEVATLVAEFILRRSPHTALYQVEGTAWAEVTQVCVVSGEPFAVKVTAVVRALFGDDAGLAADMDDDGWDDVEPIDQGEIDIGELSVQHIALNLDAYPRKPGLVSPGTFGDEKPLSPFAILQTLKDE